MAKKDEVRESLVAFMLAATTKDQVKVALGAAEAFLDVYGDDPTIMTALESVRAKEALLA